MNLYRCYDRTMRIPDCCIPKSVFLAALLANETNVIQAHKHPCGTRTPAEADIKTITVVR
ncbi:MAG: JAB domain-containing protein [Bacteroidales bacterium]